MSSNPQQFIYTIELFDEKELIWKKEKRYYYSEKSDTDFDTFPIKGKRRNFTLVATSPRKSFQ